MTAFAISKKAADGERSLIVHHFDNLDPQSRYCRFDGLQIRLKSAADQNQVMFQQMSPQT